MSTTATAPTDTTALRWKHARGLGWMTWRQQRTAYVTTAAGLGALAVILLANGVAMRSNYRHLGLSSCGAQPPAGGRSEATPSGFTRSERQC
jgi:hypothetical protein